MDTTEAPDQPIVRKGFHSLSWDLVFYLCDRLDAFGVYRIAMLTPLFWVTLQLKLYKKAAEYRRGRGGNPGRIRNIISCAIKHNADIRILEMMMEACKPIWPCWVNGGYDHRQVPPPLFMAIEKNRTDVVALLLANGAEIDAKYCWQGKKDHWHSLRSYPVEAFPMLRIYQAKNYGIRRPCDNNYVDPERDSVLEIAIRYRHKELTEQFLADPRIPVRQVALLRALSAHWKFGIHAILACDRREEFQIEEILYEEIIYCSQFNQPDWLEYLVSLGANPQQHPELPTCDQQLGLAGGTPMGISIEKGHISNVTRLLAVFDFTWEYLVHVLLLCVEQDDRLDATKILLAQTC